MVIPIFLRLLRLTLATGILAATSSVAAESDQQVDFRREIWPILQTRCVKCHGESKIKGGLRLDSRRAAEAGGNLGQNLLNEPAETNDLLRRITTSDPDQRMPLEGEPLTPAQIDLLTRWLKQGAAWPDEAPLATPVRSATPQPRFDQWLSFFEETRSVWLGVLAVMSALLLVQRAHVQQKRSGERAASGFLTRCLAAVPRWMALVGLLLVLIWGLSLRMARDRRELETLKAQLARSRGVRSEVSPEAPASQLVARHPPRLGGEYYRGNDERSPQLFNGGCYRTATLSVHLTDGDGRPCAWNDPYPAEPRITLTIERAPQASPSLFSDQIMSKTFLTPVLSPETTRDHPQSFRLLSAVVAGEKWNVAYDLPSCSASERIRGELFVCTGLRMPEGQVAGHPNYRIDYDLQIDAGQIDPRSRIELISLVQPGNLLRPEPGRIQPSEWFDFRPIPVIEGEPSTDPVLLGIPEHLSSEHEDDSP